MKPIFFRLIMGALIMATGVVICNLAFTLSIHLPTLRLITGVSGMAVGFFGFVILAGTTLGETTRTPTTVVDVNTLLDLLQEDKIKIENSDLSDDTKNSEIYRLQGKIDLLDYFRTLNDVRLYNFAKRKTG